MASRFLKGLCGEARFRVLGSVAWRCRNGLLKWPVSLGTLKGGQKGLHIAVWFEQVLTFRFAPLCVALGVYVPSQRSIKCKLYHCLIPSSLASLSAISPAIESKSPSMVLVTLCARLLKNEPIEVAVAEGPEEVVAVGIRLWPRVEVLS